jgi:hypothetical protein
MFRQSLSNPFLRNILKIQNKNFKNKMTLGANNIAFSKSPSYNKLVIKNIEANVQRDKVFYLSIIFELIFRHK